MRRIIGAKPLRPPVVPPHPTTHPPVVPPRPITNKGAGKNAAAPPSAGAVTAATRGQASASRAISTGNKLATRAKVAAAGAKLVSAGNAHAAKAAALANRAKAPVRKTLMGDWDPSVLNQAIDPTLYIQQSDVLDAVTQAGDLAYTLSGYLSALTSGGLGAVVNAVASANAAARRAM